MDDLLKDFLTESADNLGRLDIDIVELERRPEDIALLNSVFRTIHTIKGTCGFLGLVRLEGVAHVAENVLDRLRAGQLKANATLIGDVLAAIDCIKHVLHELELHEVEPEGNDDELVSRLERWLDARTSHTPIYSPAITHLDDGPATSSTSHPGTHGAQHGSTHGAQHGSTHGAQHGATHGNDSPAHPVHAAPAAYHDGKPEHVVANDSADHHEHPEARSAIADSSLRVGVNLLDTLMNLVGELALGRNQLLQLAGAHEESPFAKPVQHLDRVTTDLLDAVMRTRMQPIGNAWTKLPRLVRDLSHSSGKQITLIMHGAETELDRQILQAIADPLTHMVRNSADHGVESIAVRRAAGKPDHGTVRLSARHEGGHVVIEISDDGAGIDGAKVRRKAVERGLVRADIADTIPDAQALRFIFEPGFSTAETVTNVSGRGVGMDVVRSNIEMIGGTVELQSHFGRGTTIRVKIPLTLAIISALLVGTAGETFAVPQIGIVELVCVTDEQRALVEVVHGAKFFRLRDTLLPMVSLRELLGLGESSAIGTDNIVVCQVGNVRFGLVVEDVFDTQEIVVKPVGRLIKHLQAYAGCTITGDGRVIMILDTTGIATVAGVATNESRDEAAIAAEAAERARLASIATDTESILLFDAGYPALQAVPLALVARLEEFPLSSLEEIDGQFLVQYRGALMPVVRANPSLDLRAKDPRPVIVFSDRNRIMGLAVDEIRDIVEDRVQLQRRATRPGILGVCVIAERATEILDTDYFLRHAQPSGATSDATSDATSAPGTLAQPLSTEPARA
jgi:two-component system chemotaxis sensor kinase CheA